eukprot:6214661-Pleurochrysis_carterae.AAC.6
MMHPCALFLCLRRGGSMHILKRSGAEGWANLSPRQAFGERASPNCSRRNLSGRDEATYLPG